MRANPAIMPTLILGALLFAAGAACGRRYLRLACAFGVVLALPCLLAVFYYTHLFDNAAWFYEARSLPFFEITFAGIGFLGGAVHQWHAPATWKEWVAVPLVTAAFVLIPFIKPILDPLDLDALQDRCSGEVCLQSSLSSCGPASAATILRSFGQRVTERDLAAESFTYHGGTEAWYLARALRRRGYRANFVFSESSLPHPAIAGVRLRGGAGHFIAVLNVSGSDVRIVDPMSGPVTMPMNKLRDAYRFTGFFMKVAPQQGVP
ncbi:MAG TPA: cysteine peptidase family C39 domain-containing protein [Terriglobales bacterium]|nr:cysteine peptidase family C39 domain-containing protein [Terriglobales bacterium]